MLNWLKNKMAKVFELRVQSLRAVDESSSKELTVLNRRVKWTKAGIEMEADPRHVREVIEALGLEHANGVSSLTEPEEKAKRASRTAGGRSGDNQQSQEERQRSWRQQRRRRQRGNGRGERGPSQEERQEWSRTQRNDGRSERGP